MDHNVVNVGSLGAQSNVATDSGFVDVVKKFMPQVHIHENVLSARSRKTNNVVVESGSEGGERSQISPCCSLKDFDAQGYAFFDTSMFFESTERACVSADMSYDSFEETSDEFSVELMEPSNAKVAREKALCLYRSSTRILRAYSLLKRAVTQRTYRRYYEKWFCFFSQGLFRSMNTSATLKSLVGVSTQKDCCVKCKTLRVATVVPSTASCSLSSSRKMRSVNSEEPCRCERGRSSSDVHKRRQPATMIATGVLTAPMSGKTTALAKLLLWSKPPTLCCCSRKSTPLKKAATQSFILPSTRLPLLVLRGSPVVILPVDTTNMHSILE